MNSGVLARRVLLDIGEADIQRNQSAVFEPADLKDARVSRTAECLVQN